MPSEWLSRQKSRFQRKRLKGPQSNAQPLEDSHVLQQLVVPQTSETLATTPSVAPDLLDSPPQSIWDKAYDSIKQSEPKLAVAYELILSKELGNAIEGRDSGKRWSQMALLAQNELDKAVQRDHAKETASEFIKVVLVINGLVRSALEDAPQTSLAWVPVCFLLRVRHVSLIYYTQS